MIRSNNNTTVRCLTTKDEDFCMVVGHAYYPRASVAIDKTCPDDVKKIVQLALSKGWISAEAWIKDSEYMWEKLNDNAS